MKASELRLGNLVNWGVNIVPVKSIHTESVLKDEVRVYVELNEKLQNYCLDITEIEPTPLTEEWLLKFGFKKQDYKMSGCSIYKLGNIIIMNSFRDDGRKDMGITVEGISPPTWSLANLYFVHQLQNIYFALTGEELILNA